MGATRKTTRNLAQAYDIRDVAATRALELASVPVSTLAERCSQARALKDLAAVWNQASDRARIIRGRPLPGSEKPPARKRPTRNTGQRSRPRGPIDLADLPPDESATPTTV